MLQIKFNFRVFGEAQVSRNRKHQVTGNRAIRSNRHNFIILSKIHRMREKTYREGEVEDELEGELAELFEENVAEDYEARPDE